MRQPIDLASGAYESRSLPVSAQRLVNMYPEAMPSGSRVPFALFGTPGLTPLVTIATGAIRGMHCMDGVLYVVSGSTLYSVSSTWVETSLGSMSGVPDRVDMADNGTQLMITCGTKGYIYTVAAGLVEITDSDYPGADQVGFIDGFFLVSRDGSGEFNKSAAYDGMDWDALEYATAEGDPDYIVGQIIDHREVWLFGSKTTEVWYNAGTATMPFERMENAFIERGCAARYSVAKLVNTVFWLGDDRVVYLANAYNPERISTHAIENAIGEYGTISDAFAWTYTDEGHKFYVLTFPTENATWCYDMAAQKWHEREYYPGKRHRANAYAYAYGKHVVGDWETGRLYQMDLDTYTDAGEHIQRIGTTGMIHNMEQRSFMTMFQLVFESGVGLESALESESDPEIMLRWSDDGGKKWSNIHRRTIGEIGEYKERTIWRRLGKFRNRVYEFSFSAPCKTTVLAAYAE